MEKTFSEELHERTLAGHHLSNEDKIRLQERHKQEVQKILNNTVDEATMAKYFDCELRYLADCGQNGTMFFACPSKEKPNFSTDLKVVKTYAQKRNLDSISMPAGKHLVPAYVRVQWA